jgi:hypothetical protein
LPISFSKNRGAFIIFAPDLNTMTEVKKRRTGLYWAMCIIGAIGFTLFTLFLPQGVWLSLPFLFGGLVMAMDWV